MNSNNQHNKLILMEVDGQYIDRPPLILIYYKFRGQLQPIRSLLCYMEVPFLEVHLQCLQQQRKKMPSEIVNHVRKFRIDRSQLPAMIHGSLYAEGQFAISIYLCKKFNHPELLGSNIYVRSKVYQTLDIYVKQHGKSMVGMMQFADKAATLSEAQLNLTAMRFHQDIMNNSKYGRAFCQYLDRQKRPAFVLGELTLLDFFYIESCFYAKNICGIKERANMVQFQEWNEQQDHFLDKPNFYYMAIMKGYEDDFRQQPWYIRHKNYLESFSIIPSTIDEKRAKGLRRAWLGDPKFIT